MRKKKIVFASLFLILVLGAAIIFVFAVKTRLTYNPDWARKAGRGVPVKSVKATVSDVVETVGGNSLVLPVSSDDGYAMITSTVKSVDAEVGALVDANQRLITLDDTVFKAALRAAESTLAKAEAILAQSKIQYRRFAELYSKGYASKLELEEVELTLKTNEANYRDAISGLERAKKNIEYTSIHSPIKGIITQRKVDYGQSVREGDLLISIGNIDKVYVVAEIAEEKISRISLGQAAEISFDSYPNLSVPGKVFKIDPNVDSKTRTFKAFIEVENKDYMFKPGLSGYARLDYKFRGLVIPALALLKNQNESSVFVVEDGTARLRKISVQNVFYDKISVLDGLKDGEEVVCYGLLNLKDGDKINTQAYQ
jgi:RND family efflux transporter MFP subunit